MGVVTKVAKRSRTEKPTTPPLAGGTALSPGYTVIGHLHRSRVLDVYEVWSKERECRCIAKLLVPERLDDERARAELTREGRLLRRFTHPHIVRAYETLREPQPVVILETLTGATLEHMIDSARRRLAWVDLVYLGLHLSSAMHYMHGEGVLHIDLKPANIVVGDDGRTRVLDLSLARSPGPIRRGVGTPIYMAPEQARGAGLDAAADVWGIGIVLYEAATGRAAFDDEPDRQHEYPQLERRTDPVHVHRRLPPPLADAIDACLEPEPAARPTIRQLARSLQRLEL